MSERRSFARLIVRTALLLPALSLLLLRAQDPRSSADHPPGNVNETTLAGLQPGRAVLADAVARFGPAWFHPSAEELHGYVWCDLHAGLEVAVDTGDRDSIRVVTVRNLAVAPPRPAAGPGQPHPPDCGATLAPGDAGTGRGVRLGDAPGRLRAVYGRPFFDGPSSLRGKDTRLIVYNFSWAGAELPQILESTFDTSGRLVQLTLSADYY